MELQEIQRVATAKPFKPFEIVLSNTQRLPVGSASEIEFPRGTIVLWRGGKNGDRPLLFEASSVFALQL